MKGSLEQCIEYILTEKEKSILLVDGDKFEAIKARSIRAEKVPLEVIVGVFNKHADPEDIRYEAMY